MQIAAELQSHHIDATALRKDEPAFRQELEEYEASKKSRRPRL
jgi:hypothetical protein